MTRTIERQLTHVEWGGFPFEDLIFPLFVFVVIGMNAITIYFLQRFVDFEAIAEFFLGGVARHAGLIAPLLLPFGALMIRWLVLHFLYRHRVFLRV